MGCIKKNLYVRKAGDLKKALIITLIGAMFVSAITPVVLAGPHADYIKVTFTPTGDISLDVTNGTAVFGDVAAGTVNATIPGMATSGSYTLYNNGTVAAHVYIWTNQTTNGGSATDWTLDEDGSPIADNFCLRRWNNTGGNGYIQGTNTSWIDSLAGSGGTKLFGITLDLGIASNSSHLSAQITRINITGVAAT